MLSSVRFEDLTVGVW